ncbi:MAG: hypothetical protein HYT13_00745 [Candidatus Liptonbacteria bacterium]|nr:hypothetical protein [Candidatus Liptonbacteria bacterium]
MISWILEKILSWSGLFERALATHVSGHQISINLVNPISNCSGVNANLGCVATKIAEALFYVAIPIVSIMVLIGAFQLLTSAGNPEKVQTGKKTLFWAVGGFLVIILGLGITAIIKNFFQIP